MKFGIARTQEFRCVGRIVECPGPSDRFKSERRSFSRSRFGVNIDSLLSRSIFMSNTYPSPFFKGYLMANFIASHDLVLVALSYLVAVIGAFVSLYISDYIVGRDGSIQFGWLALAALVFGGCAIWAMHFIGMLAYRTDMVVTYEISRTLTSAAFPVVLCFAAFYTVYKWRSTAAWLVSGLLFGAGVAAMHYVGMGALRMAATMTHDPVLYWVSIAIAILAATAALRIFTRWTGMKRLASPLLMGLAVCGMHYTAMAGMRMMPMAESLPAAQYFEGAWTSDMIGFTTGLFAVLTIMLGAVLVIFRKTIDIDAGSSTHWSRAAG
jgi:NO-binding membrane sensor protein with MHYT domain